MNKNKLSDKLLNIVIALLFIVGIGLILYPSLSNYISSLNQSRAMANYINSINDNGYNEEIITKAKKYNEEIYNDNIKFANRDVNEEYYNLLKFDNTDIMSIISIPKIDLILPIYHGTSEGVLQNGIGHLGGSSLPIGGINTHTVLMGHRGLPSSKLFTYLDKVEIGDIVYLQTGNIHLAYEVDDIKIVEPNELFDLKIYDNKDYLTLITCTPYGINTHRLVIGAARKELSLEQSKELEISNLKNNSKNIKKNLIILVSSVVIILLVLVLVIIFYHKKIKHPKKS